MIARSANHVPALTAAAPSLRVDQDVAADAAISVQGATTTLRSRVRVPQSAISSWNPVRFFRT